MRIEKKKKNAIRSQKVYRALSKYTPPPLPISRFAYRYCNYYQLFVLRNTNSKIFGSLPMANIFSLFVLFKFICIRSMWYFSLVFGIWIFFTSWCRLFAFSSFCEFKPVWFTCVRCGTSDVSEEFMQGK